MHKILSYLPSWFSLKWPFSHGAINHASCAQSTEKYKPTYISKKPMYRNIYIYNFLYLLHANCFLSIVYIYELYWSNVSFLVRVNRVSKFLLQVPCWYASCCRYHVDMLLVAGTMLICFLLQVPCWYASCCR